MRVGSCLLLGLALLTAGCGMYQVRRVDTPQIPAPLVRKIPLAVGVYYSPQFRDAQPQAGTTYMGGDRKETWVLGTANVAIFDTTLHGLFENVIEVKQWPPSGEPLKLAGVLVPSMPTDSVGQSITQTWVRYRIDLFSSAGEELGSWQVAGISGARKEELPMWFPFTGFMNEALRSAAASFVASFFSDPQARAWLEANGVRPAALR